MLPFTLQISLVTPNHNLTTSKCDYLLGEPWVQIGPWGQYRQHLGWSSTDDSSEKSNFLLSNLPSGCGPWRTQHCFLAVSCSALVSGQQYESDHLKQESDVQFLMKQASLASTPPGAVRRTSKLSSRAVVLRCLPVWTSPVSW